MSVAILKLEGRIDSAEAAKLEAGFAAQAGALTGQDDRAIVDLSGVVYLSSMGIRMLLSAIKQFQQRGVRFVTVRPREKLANKILQTASLTDHLNMVENLDAAHAAFNQ